MLPRDVVGTGAATAQSQEGDRTAAGWSRGRYLGPGRPPPGVADGRSARDGRRHRVRPLMGAQSLSPAGRAGLGAACVACCAGPMLLLAGVVSVGAFVTGGVALGSVGVVGMAALAVHRRWIGSTSPWLRLAIGAIGVLLSGIGLAVLDDSRDAGRSFVSAGLAALACAGMLALHPGGRRPADRAHLVERALSRAREKQRNINGGAGGDDDPNGPHAA